MNNIAMKKSGLIVLLLVAMGSSVSFAQDTTTANPNMDSAQARAQAFQNMTPQQQQAAIGAAQQQGQATAQQKQANWNSMTPEQQQAQKQTMQSNMQTQMQGVNGQSMNGQMGNNQMGNNQMGNSQMGNNHMGNGQMGGNMNSGMKMQMQEKMQGMRSRMAR